MLAVLRFTLLSFRNVLVFLLAAALSVALLTVMPMVQYIGMTGNMPGTKEKTFQVAPISQTLPPKKRPKPKTEKPKPMQNNSSQTPKSMARSTLSMDLGVGGGTGGVDIGGVGSGDGGQMVYEEGETDEDAIPVRQVAPRYPDEARKAGVGGVVRVLITVQEDGSVGDIRFLETPGDYGFDKSVREALAQWKFQPARVGGVPVKQKMEQPFQF